MYAKLNNFNEVHDASVSFRRVNAKSKTSFNSFE